VGINPLITSDIVLEQEPGNPCCDTVKLLYHRMTRNFPGRARVGTGMVGGVGALVYQQYIGLEILQDFYC
jgi:hypothetical protein